MPDIPAKPDLPLPPIAAERMRHLEALRDDRHAVTLAALQQQTEAEQQLRDANLVLKRAGAPSQGTRAR